MGFVPKRKIYNLVFEGEEFEGLLIKARSVPSGTFLDITERARAAAEDPSSMGASTRKLFEDFAAAVIEWNLETDIETPWPVGVEALYAQDFTWVTQIIGAWMAAIGGAQAPLVTSSTGGEPTAIEASIPMDVPSPNPSS